MSSLSKNVAESFQWVKPQAVVGVGKAGEAVSLQIASWLSFSGEDPEVRSFWLQQKENGELFFDDPEVIKNTLAGKRVLIVQYFAASESSIRAAAKMIRDMEGSPVGSAVFFFAGEIDERSMKNIPDFIYLLKIIQE